MKVYLVWEWEQYEQANVIEIFLDEQKANSFIKDLDREPGLYYRIEERNVNE